MPQSRSAVVVIGLEIEHDELTKVAISAMRVPDGALIRSTVPQVADLPDDFRTALLAWLNSD